MADISKRKATIIYLTKKTIMPYNITSYTRPYVHRRTRENKSTTHYASLQ